MGLTFRDRLAVRLSKAYLNVGEVFLYVPFARVHKGLIKTKGLRYGEGKRAALDVIRPVGGKEKLPLFVYIHGGGFVSGIRPNRRFYCYNWAEDGFVAANIGYDYALDAKHPEHIRQIFKGIEFVLERAEEYGIDDSRVVVAGDSAGAYFASLVGAVASHPDLYDALGIDFKFRRSFRVSACVLLSGLFDPVRSIGTGFPSIALYVKALLGKSDAELVQDSSRGNALPAASDAYADSSFPPCFIVESKADRLKTESETLRDELADACVKHGFFTCTGINGVHAGALACELAPSGRECLAAAKAFVGEVFADLDRIDKIKSSI